MSLYYSREAVSPIVDYSPLWETMRRKAISQYRLIQSGKNITMLTLEKLCRILDCTPNDIVKFK